MIDEIASSIVASNTGIEHTIIRRSLDAGKEIPENKEIKIIRKLEYERKRIQPTYDSRGQVIEYDDSGRHLDMKA